MTAWLPIEHAPKDRPVDLWGRGRYIATGLTDPRRWTDCRWMDGKSDPGIGVDGWYCYDGHLRFIEPTHYMEIPEGPK